jgi:DNA-binding GntR family transcriptional regulator
MVAKLFYELRRQLIGVARDKKQAAEEHLLIYQAIRAHDRERAREAMANHLRRAALTQVKEDSAAGPGPARRREEDNA